MCASFSSWPGLTGHRRHCEEQSDEAIQFLLCRLLDCFASSGGASRRPLARNDGFLRASAIAARKFLRVNGGSVNLPRRERGRRNAERRTLGNGRGLFPGSPGNRGTRQRLSTFRHGVVGLVRASGDLAHGDFAPLPVPVQPASVADPDSGAGRIPKHSRERRATLAPALRRRSHPHVPKRPR
jgi:hypothetical protein